jgi:hypothetical protein
MVGCMREIDLGDIDAQLTVVFSITRNYPYNSTLN